MDKTLQKKLKAYSLTAGSLTAAVAAQGQIIHTDPSPDIVIDSAATYALDINNDNTAEFSLYAFNYLDSANSLSGYALLDVEPPVVNAVLGNLFSNTYPFPSALNAGDSIRPGATDWQDGSVNNGYQYLAVVLPQPGPMYGNWPGISDKYIGVRFAAGSQTHYGWARLSVSADGGTITLKEYAYNTTAGQGIVAGQTTAVGVAEQPAGTPAVHVYDRTLFVNLTPEMQLGGTLQVFNTTGQVVYTESINEASMRISLGDLASGVYLVQVIQPNGEVVTRKIYI
ncbi:MAG: T9SS type A sorting domain-containing protein [Bacteroidetes bacterium]|nr:T9SS type A sorting domain-containing protein [Bacteroidota bacterium]